MKTISVSGVSIYFYTNNLFLTLLESVFGLFVSMFKYNIIYKSVINKYYATNLLGS